MKKARIEITPEFPDWKLTIYVGNEEIGSGYFASLAEALIFSYNKLSEIYNIPDTFDGCPEHHPQVKEVRTWKKRIRKRWWRAGTLR